MLLIIIVCIYIVRITCGNKWSLFICHLSLLTPNELSCWSLRGQLGSPWQPLELHSNNNVNIPIISLQCEWSHCQCRIRAELGINISEWCARSPCPDEAHEGVKWWIWKWRRCLVTGDDTPVVIDAGVPTPAYKSMTRLPVRIRLKLARKRGWGGWNKRHFWNWGSYLFFFFITGRNLEQGPARMEG